jgi:hypothetical protein
MTDTEKDAAIHEDGNYYTVGIVVSRVGYDRLVRVEKLAGELGEAVNWLDPIRPCQDTEFDTRYRVNAEALEKVMAKTVELRAEIAKGGA